MYQQILEMLLGKYGDLSYSELTETLRKDGLGEFVDAIENDPHLMELIADISEEYSPDLLGDPEYGIIPEAVQQATGIPVDYHGTFRFDRQACLKVCKGECCRNKNYLMINIHDIFRILSSKGAQFYDVDSTIDLFDRKPPLVELFYIEEYRLFFPYIRYLPVDADVHTRPENAEESICPFLHPIHDVYSYHKRALPLWASKDAWGCMLMEDKPTVCRLSPLGRSAGMVTGKVTYEYLPPAVDCPACETHVKVKVSDYLSSMVSSAEEQQQERFHKMLMSYHRAATSKEVDRNCINEIIKHVYNIDGLLHEYGLDSQHRPRVEHLVEMVFAASHGNLSVYQHFINGLRRRV